MWDEGLVCSVARPKPEWVKRERDVKTQKKHSLTRRREKEKRKRKEDLEIARRKGKSTKTKSKKKTTKKRSEKMGTDLPLFVVLVFFIQ